MTRAFLEMELRMHLRRAAELEEQLREMDFGELPAEPEKNTRRRRKHAPRPASDNAVSDLAIERARRMLGE